MTGADVLALAAPILQDVDATRWDAAELLAWVDAGQKEAHIQRPDLFNKTAEMTCVAGPRQAIPSGSKLIAVHRNTSTNGRGRVVTPCERALLDAQLPGWQTIAGKEDVQHSMYDALDAKAFWVYPPALSSTKLLISYAAIPAKLTTTATALVLDDLWVNAMADYVLYRAFSKDAEHADAGQRAIAHWTAFVNALGIDMKATAGVSPPNTRGATAATA